MTHHQQPNPQFTLGFTLGIVHSMDSDKCNDIYPFFKMLFILIGG